MLRNHLGDPDVEWEADGAAIELIEVQPDEILCAFVVECPPLVQEAAKRYWRETIAVTAAHSMLKFIQNQVEHGD